MSRLFQHELDHLNGRIFFHRNAKDFMLSRELSEDNMDKFVQMVDEKINKTTTRVCPFVEKDMSFQNMLPLIGKKSYECSAQDNNPDCSEHTEMYCFTVEHEHCKYFDKRLII